MRTSGIVRRGSFLIWDICAEMLLVACWLRWCWCVVFFFDVPGYDGIGILEMALFDRGWTYFIGRGRILSNSSHAREGF